MLYYLIIHRVRVGLPPWRRNIRVGAFNPPYSGFLQADHMTPNVSVFAKTLQKVLEEDDEDEVTHIYINDLRHLFKKLTNFNFSMSKKLHNFAAEN